MTGLAEANDLKGIFKTKVKGDLATVNIEQKVKIAKEAEIQARNVLGNYKICILYLP